MGFYNKFYFHFLLCIFFCGMASGQTSTIGKEFWVGFMENNTIQSSGFTTPSNLVGYTVIIITASESTTGLIEYAGQSEPFSLSAGDQHLFCISTGDLDLMHRTSGVIENKGIHIISSGDIAVHAFNERVKSADGTVVLPIGALGKEYWITSHFENFTQPVQLSDYTPNMDNESTLLIVAVEDNTEIEITTSVNSISGHTAGVPSTVTLNAGQSYQVKARADLTGSRVRVVGDDAGDCKKIAVFGGNKWTSVGDCGQASDHLFQQAYPVSSWGKSFVHVSLAGRSSGELVKVLAAEDGTEVKVDGVVKGTVDKGKFLILEFGMDKSAKIEISRPASVTVFSKSMGCNDQSAPNSNFGDPFMITYSPSEQFLRSLVFNAIDLPSIVNHYVNIIVKTGTQDQTVLDGENIGSSFSPLPGDPEYQIAQVEIAVGAHNLTNSGGFAAYVYGFGEIESYGYAAGAALDNLSFKVQSDYEFEVVGEKIACLDQEGTWKVEPENPDFKYFVWDYGDGSDPVEGQELSHTFTETGTFEVKVTASISPNSCDQQQEIVFQVEVIKTKAKLTGELSVCPLVEEVMYRVTEKENVASVSYEVIGGTVLEEYGQDSVLVQWAAANPEAKLILTPYLESGCPGVPVELAVKVNPILDAPMPTGLQEVCFGTVASHIYQVPNPVAGRGYRWAVTGGELLSGQGKSSVEIVWNQSAVLGKVSYSVYNLVDKSCGGDSPEITVKVSEEISTQFEVNHVKCSGEASGSIVLETEGADTFNFLWAHDPDLKGPEARNLPVGLYTVIIRDPLGCERKIEQVEITEPDPIMLVSEEVQGASCHGKGKADGQAQFVLSGGTPPYQVDLNGLQFFTGQLSLAGLESGEYSLKVQDQVGCSFPINFEITSPPAMELKIELTKPACPGGTGGELTAVTEGLEGPLSYQWTWHNVEGGWMEKESSSPTFSDLVLGEYYLSVIDKNGCAYSGVADVTEGVQIRMPTGFDPRQGSGLFEGVATCEVDFQLWIYNRWGQLIYFGNEGWDGKVDGDEAPVGSYSYIAQYNYTIHEVSEEVIGGDVIVREVIPKNTTEYRRGAFMLVR